jgi:hypothetical protein
MGMVRSGMIFQNPAELKKNNPESYSIWQKTSSEFYIIEEKTSSESYSSDKKTSHESYSIEKNLISSVLTKNRFRILQYWQKN